MSNPFITLIDSNESKKPKVDRIERPKHKRGTKKKSGIINDAQEKFYNKLKLTYNAIFTSVAEEFAAAKNNHYTIKFTRPVDEVMSIHKFIENASKLYGEIVPDACLSTGYLDNIFWITFKDKTGYDKCMSSNNWMSRQTYETWQIGNYYRILIKINVPDITLDAIRTIKGFSSVESIRYTRSDTIQVYFNDSTDWINCAKSYQIIEKGVTLIPFPWSMSFKNSRLVGLVITPQRVVLEQEFKFYMEKLAKVLKLPTPVFHFVSVVATKKFIYTDRIWAQLLLWIQEYITKNVVIHDNWNFTPKQEYKKEDDNEVEDE